MRRFLVCLLTISLVFGMGFAITGCAENADVIQEANGPEYDVLMERIETVHQGYSDFMNAGEGEIFYKNSDGITPDEIPCYVTYVESADRTYRVCTLTATRGDIESVYDEYTYIDDTTLFIVRSYLSNDGVGVIDKYVVLDNNLYYINEETHTFELSSKPDSLGFYLSFSELTALYGAEAAE